MGIDSGAFEAFADRWECTFRARGATPLIRCRVPLVIEALLANGSTQKFIAKRYNTTPANLSNWMEKNGNKKPKA